MHDHAVCALTPSCIVTTSCRPPEVAELLGEESVSDAEAALAGADPEVAAAVRAVLVQFPFTLDPFQVRC